jgi:hypothetical protein
MWGENDGWITFDSAAPFASKIQTDWCLATPPRPVAPRSRSRSLGRIGTQIRHYMTPAYTLFRTIPVGHGVDSLWRASDGAQQLYDQESGWGIEPVLPLIKWSSTAV